MKWTQDEIKFIKQNIADLSIQQMKEQYLKDRTVNAIKAKVYDLGLKIPRIRKRCKVCGKLVKHRRHDYCSRSCSNHARRKFRFSKSELYNLYAVQGLSAKSIGEEHKWIFGYSVGETTVFRYLDEFHIKRIKNRRDLLKKLFEPKEGSKDMFIIFVRRGEADNLRFALKNLAREHSYGEIEIKFVDGRMLNRKVQKSEIFE
jgi:hypothetical protein